MLHHINQITFLNPVYHEQQPCIVTQGQTKVNSFLNLDFKSYISKEIKNQNRFHTNLKNVC